MRYLFIIQGEGRGHLTQAITMEKMLLSRGHDVVRMLVGKSPSRTLPAFFTNGVKAPLAYFESVNFVTAASDYVVACRGGNLLVYPAADEQKIKDYAADAPSR